jgi:HSP20 family protein
MMSNLDNLRRGLSQAWDTVAEGWREFTERAGGALTRFNPVHRTSDIETQADRKVAASPRWGILAAEVALTDDAVEVSLEAPGMDAEDFHIDVVDDVLVVRGEKRVESDGMRGRFHVMERAYGSFERAMRLPVAVDESAAKADYKRGVLNISIPRAVHSKARRIPVRAD